MAYETFDDVAGCCASSTISTTASGCTPRSDAAALQTSKGACPADGQIRSLTLSTREGALQSAATPRQWTPSATENKPSLSGWG
jgi:hypothetical protein